MHIGFVEEEPDAGEVNTEMSRHDALPTGYRRDFTQQSITQNLNSSTAVLRYQKTFYESYVHRVKFVIAESNLFLESIGRISSTFFLQKSLISFLCAKCR